MAIWAQCSSATPTCAAPVAVALGAMGKKDKKHRKKDKGEFLGFLSVLVMNNFDLFMYYVWALLGL